MLPELDIRFPELLVFYILHLPEKEHYIYLNPSDDQKFVLLNKLEGEIDYLKSLIAQLRHALEEE